MHLKFELGLWENPVGDPAQKAKVGSAEVSDRDTNFIVCEAGTSARDVLRLIDLVRSRVQERFGVELELEITIW